MVRSTGKRNTAVHNAFHIIIREEGWNIQRMELRLSTEIRGIPRCIYMDFTGHLLAIHFCRKFCDIHISIFDIKKSCPIS